MSPTPFYTQTGRAVLSTLDSGAIDERAGNAAEAIRTIIRDTTLRTSERMTWLGRLQSLERKRLEARNTDLQQLVAAGYLANVEGAVKRWHESRSL